MKRYLLALVCVATAGALAMADESKNQSQQKATVSAPAADESPKTSLTPAIMRYRRLQKLNPGLSEKWEEGLKALLDRYRNPATSLEPVDATPVTETASQDDSAVATTSPEQEMATAPEPEQEAATGLIEVIPSGGGPVPSERERVETLEAMVSVQQKRIETLEKMYAELQARLDNPSVNASGKEKSREVDQ
jgi:hypothetical protein